MSKKTSSTQRSISATTARLLLAGLLLFLLLGVAAGFYGAYSFLSSTASDVAKAKSEAESSRARVQNLEKLSVQLRQEADAVKKAANIAADAKSYLYQNQIIHDLSIYARRAGITITSFAFNQAAGSASPSAPTTPSNQSSSNAPKTTKVSIQLNDDVSYQNILRFLHLIEQNVTRMQVVSVSLSRGKDGGTVSMQSLDLEVYIR
ncbi:MAG: hypothetical protein Q4A34_01805 [Candidatus Saccharibacteria bacterium]|nr:hypothetical protein [Candidatus Saccharibacteria bacterium]